jgi:hypothetical protein
MSIIPHLDSHHKKIFYAIHSIYNASSIAAAALCCLLLWFGLQDDRYLLKKHQTLARLGKR